MAEDYHRTRAISLAETAMTAPTAEPLLPIDDQHNRKLVANVHPPDWVNPEPAPRYHLVVIGGGTAGLVSAAGAAGLGARVALVERHLLGGDCLNFGCIPSKGLISVARSWHAARKGRACFGGPDVVGDGNFAVAMDRMRRLRAGISQLDSVARFRDLGVDVFIGGATFGGPDTIEVGKTSLRFRRAVIATGARAAVPPIPGLDVVDYLTNETIFALTALPSRLGVIGSGPIGSEMAQAFARLGSQVTVFEMAGQVLPREDEDAAAVVEASMVADGVQLQLGVQVKEVANRDGGICVRFEREGAVSEVELDQLLVAVGRKPNVEDLGLEAAKVHYDIDGVQVDDRLRSTNVRVFACGDVVPGHKFTHTADAQARIVIQNALLMGRAKNSALVVPWCTYTSPEVAHIGMYEADAIREGLEVDTLTIPLSQVDRAVLEGEEDGFLRIHLLKGKDRILGATLVAAHAGDMIGELCLAMRAGIGLGKIASTIHPYPTQGEVIKKAADAWRRTKLTPKIKRILDAWFRLTA